MLKTVVLQSHRKPLPHPWLSRCCETVRNWCASQGYQYHWLGDEIFASLPPFIRQKTQNQIVVASDIARLLAIRDHLAQGFDCVVWLDADTLVITPDCLTLSVESVELGREIWVQPATNKSTAQIYTKVHNAYLLFRRQNHFLDFYINSAVRLLERHSGPYVSQFVGPKFLTAIHNIVALPVNERAGVLSPFVIRDILSGGGNYLDAFVSRCTQLPAALNLCASSVANADLTDDDMIRLCEILDRQDCFCSPKFVGYDQL